MENQMASMDTGARGRRNGHAARNAFKARTTDVLDDFTELRKDMSRLAHAANKAARDEMKSASRKLQDIGRDLRTRADEGAQQAVESVREHPGMAIGASLGAGLLLGFLLARR
jgi:ElaB/YqjD/DUF883 family membrane-anchored ribosome-binding protein